MLLSTHTRHFALRELGRNCRS